MDAAGKDGAIKNVMSGVNPQGCQVFSYRHPAPEELEHDFLWRTTDLPERGRIGIFNRSYYEEVLIVAGASGDFARAGVPRRGRDRPSGRSGTFIQEHGRSSVRNGTRIMKFFLHLSKDEQESD